MTKIYAATLETTGEPLLIKEGEMGYWPGPMVADVRAWNECQGHTAPEVAAAVMGSMFGWDAPGANPDNYTPEIAEAMVYGDKKAA